MTKLMEEAKQGVKKAGYRVSEVSSWEDETWVYAFSKETSGPATYNAPAFSLAYNKPTNSWIKSGQQK